jgi:kumamolisin
MSEQKENSQSRVSFPNSERRVRPGDNIRGRSDAHRIISVSVIVKRKTPLDLKALRGRHVSQEEFADKYGADAAAFESLRAFARKSGLTVDDGASSLARRTLVMRGSISNVEKAFGVTLSDYKRDGKSYHSYVGSISMDADHARFVQAVLGLDNHPPARPHFRLRDRSNAVPAVSPLLTPPQVAQLYGFPTDVNGFGQTIGFIELGGGYNTSDLEAFFSGLGLAVPRVTAVSVDDAMTSPTGDPAGPDAEVALDIQVAGSMANGANLVVYFAPPSTQGFLDALTTALHDTANGPPSVISISWGGAESEYTGLELTAFDDACQSAAALGITVTAASGDDGSSDGESGNHVDFPSSSPHVLACGGTALTGSGGTITQEVVWNDGDGNGATGGGVSTFFQLPLYQVNAGVPTTSTTEYFRGVPDVAGNAAPATGYTINIDGTQYQGVGGTSAVAPLWAGLIALLNQRRGSNLGFIHPTLYEHAGTGCRDIVQGNNGAYSAGAGWDPCTGLGSPNGAGLAQIFASTVGTLTVSPSALTFPTVEETQISPQQVVNITVLGSGQLQINAVALVDATGGVSTDFVCVPPVGSPPPAGSIIVQDGELNITVWFAPKHSGPIHATLVITHNFPGSPTVIPLSGTGVEVPLPILSYSPSELIFNPKEIENHTVTLGNKGTAPLTITSIAITSPNYSMNNSCNAGAGPRTLQPGDQCTVFVSYNFIGPGGSSEMVINHNAAGSPTMIDLEASDKSGKNP